MDSKLTLHVNKDLAKKAKIYARNRGRSLSDLVENYFKFITKTTEKSRDEISPKVKSLLGSFKIPSEFEYKKDLTDQLSRKYHRDD